MLASGTKFGPYEIQSPLGAGGMGEVYRALDTRLDRTVAIKILPDHLSQSPEAKHRFDREARAISSLNHPNICTLHDVGHQNGADYLVMEFLEGETLADRLTKGALPVAQILKYGDFRDSDLDRLVASVSCKAHRARIPSVWLFAGSIRRDGGCTNGPSGRIPQRSERTGLSIELTRDQIDADFVPSPAQVN